MEPPPCVQNAMMKQDKKPFTYTPGGIDLSEIRSPRMARRIERNANWDGVTEAPRPQPPPPSQNISQLPPSTLAAMQPQMHVQVFPSGPPPPPPGARNVGVAPPPPPPPPPSSSNGKIPPPPPPPLQPLPTQKVVMNDNQVVERPDMTKIIPDNPMALLRKTGGPKPRPTLVDEMFTKPNQTNQIKTPPIQQQTPFNVQPQQQQQQTVPQSPIKTPTLQRPKSFIEESYNNAQQNNNQWSPPTQTVQQQNHKPQPWSPQAQNTQQWSPPIIERQVEQPVKTSTAHIGSLYIPPANQQQSQQQKIQQPPPPTPPKRDSQSPQSPSTPTLKEAPKPWQKQQQSQELPPWAKKETSVGPPSPQIQQQQSPPIQQQQQQSPPIQQQQQYRPPPNRWSNQRPPSPKQESQQQQQSAPNVVYVTQPLVFQHPGPQPNRQQQQQQQPQQKPRVDAQGARIIPIQIEGANQRPPSKVNSPATPITPSNERSFNRQQSWNNTPTQSNAFKIIQKITQTDDDVDGNDNQPVTEHGPRYPQQFQQQQQQQQIPTDQMRKMKLSEGDRELMNKLKQGVDDETYLHNEIDPRYRGAAIPSKAFKLLQSMTDGTNDNSTIPSVSRGPAPSNNKQAQVRTIPIQIENGAPQKYVPPSEQTVPEPKKYTGSAIPSRSFKILQAMTAPESCANANEVNEYNDPSSYYHWNYDHPNYPPLPPPFWPDYYHYYYSNCTNNNDDKNNNNNLNKENVEKNNRQTPVPFWGYYPPPPPPPAYMQKQCKTSDTESDSETATRNTPLPFWGGYFPGYFIPTPTTDSENYSQDYQINYAQYPPYFDPYYYHNLYYYGYPPYGFYPTTSCDVEDVNGYSSIDERSSNLSKQFVEESKSITPKILVTSTIAEEEEEETKQKKSGKDDEQTSALSFSSSESDSETEVEDNDDNIRCSHPNGLQAIKSVADINIYNNHSDDDTAAAEEEEEENSEETDSASVYVIDDDTIPHQLSVIFEESERTDTSKREMSVFSDSTTVADKTDNEAEEEEEEDEIDEEEEEISVSISLPLRVVKESEITASFTLKTPESSRTVSRSEDHDNDDIEKIDEKEEEQDGGGDKKNDDDDEQDWWGIINKNEDDFYPRRTKIIQETYEEPTVTSTTTTTTTTDENCEISKDINEDVADDSDGNSSGSSSNSDDDDDDSDEASSSSSSDSSSSKSNTSKQSELRIIKVEASVQKEKLRQLEEESTKVMSCIENNENKGDDDNIKMLTIKERIQALKASIRKKEISLKGEEGEEVKEDKSKQKEEEKQIKNSVKEKVSAIENSNGSNMLTTTTAISTKSSVKSFEELSEEEGDSGVTSDMSRHNISDNDEFPELRKMTRYQRAATHSRLYKLLQGECEEDENNDDDDDVNDNRDTEQNRRNQLSLPLGGSTSFDLNSNQTSPTSSINDKLINELVQSMLKRKKGQNFRHLPKEKLQSAAKRILQEEFDDLSSSTPDSSFLSPLRNNTESSTPAQTPQEFYNDYKQYYDTWNDYNDSSSINNNINDGNIDVFPSKAFKLLQEHTGLNRTGAIAGLLAKCPKILSSKNVHQELIKLIEQQSANNNPIIDDSNHDAP